jgi:hypothetical protein
MVNAKEYFSNSDNTFDLLAVGIAVRAMILDQLHDSLNVILGPS